MCFNGSTKPTLVRGVRAVLSNILRLDGSR
jgi:hypothetical protein